MSGIKFASFILFSMKRLYTTPAITNTFQGFLWTMQKSVAVVGQFLVNNEEIDLRQMMTLEITTKRLIISNSTGVKYSGTLFNPREYFLFDKY